MSEIKPSLTASTPILDVAPALMENFCQIMDSHDGSLGWRGLAERISTDWLEFRTIERLAEQGKSRTRELLWMWGLKNKTVGDLLQLLHDMDHQRAIHLFVQKGVKPRSLFNYEDIVLATRNFHQDFRIGEGAFSEVYKAVIRDKAFAVKVFKREGSAEWKKQWKCFLSEIEELLLFRHPNILELAGYCSENDKYCLASKYMKNGSLLDRLNCLGHTAPLAWSIRLQVITGLARAIQYLHTAQHCAVICGNITSANVLLDEEFQPKLSDFGLACLRPHSVNQNKKISMNVRTCKTIGYLPEEYIRQGKLCTTVDIYSFGVIVMEILIGKQIVLHPPKAVLLRNLVVETVEKSGGVESCLAMLDQSAGTWPHNISIPLFNLAVQCSASRVKIRPQMAQVLGLLEPLQIAEEFQNDCPHSLKSCEPISVSNIHQYRIPVEDDEILCGAPISESGDTKAYYCHSPSWSEAKPLKTPCECSQSEAMSIGGEKNYSDFGSHTVINELSQARYQTSTWRTGIQEFQASGTSNKSKDGAFWTRKQPAECSCGSLDLWSVCEECIANGLMDRPTPQSESQIKNTRGNHLLDPERVEIVENQAKLRLKEKIVLYNKNVLKSEELFLS